MSSKGIIYSATCKEKHVLKAFKSEKKKKNIAPDIPITLYTNFSHLTCPYIDNIIHVETPTKRSKLDAIISTPYNNTLYLDNDTILCEDIITEEHNNIFLLLSRVDIALAHAPIRVAKFIKGVPFCYPEFNSGVIVYKRSNAVINMFREWRDLWYMNKKQQDQPILRKLIWESNLQVATLPPEYNIRPRSLELPSTYLLHHH